MTTLQQQARALGDPTRHRIFRYIADSDRPADVTEMTAHFGLNHNAIRQHLAKLVDAGLVVESISATRGRGRPRSSTSSTRRPMDGGVTSPYERLSVLLTEMIHEGENPVEAGARAGRRHRVDGSTAEHAVAGITAAMAREGYDPEPRHRRGRTEIVLRNCPFESAALADPDTVCALHLGIAGGLAEGTPLVVEDLIRHDPRRANCLLRLPPPPPPLALAAVAARRTPSLSPGVAARQPHTRSTRQRDGGPLTWRSSSDRHRPHSNRPCRSSPPPLRLGCSAARSARLGGARAVHGRSQTHRDHVRRRRDRVLHRRRHRGVGIQPSWPGRTARSCRPTSTTRCSRCTPRR